MDPATGASTCALGNQRCTENIGSFTRKAAKIRNVKKFQDHGNKFRLIWRILENNIFVDFNWLLAQRITNNRGKDAATV